jgi:hypothetical protein
LEKIVQAIYNWFQELTAEKKRRLVYVCTGVLLLGLTLSVVFSLVNRQKEEANRVLLTEPERIITSLPIPINELFLPDEPDFVPGVLLGRERRTFWTEDDAAEFWQDPLRFGEEPWRLQIENAIDEMLERIP